MDIQGIESKAVAVFTIIPGGGWIERSLLEELRRQLQYIVPMLAEGKEFEIQDMVLPEFWKPLPKGNKRDLGRVLARWVSQGELGLEFVGCPRCNRKRYRRRR